MKLLFGTLGLMGIATSTLILGSATQAEARCVVTDVGVQVAVRGSRNPARQSNDVDVDSRGSCEGNRSVNTSRQVYVGNSDEVVQERRSRHQLNGSGRGSGDPMVVPVNVQVDVYNAGERYRRR
ncbi:hypothetical protein GS597_16895 [Synechococcales cyanobacterium C]|uniref:Uncharacterized protein n=1 Tax=Petrachloros mirabilis ULC683 TaxID=2781853 RepID=A0A8K2A9D3_9CYAN|nr:hypothetical protein [Petrachloros mirabilis]NCJ08154.1 hypothetical protein [Petrachloros mirabilis ULC683]